MPLNKFFPKNCVRFNRKKCDCVKCKDLDLLKPNKCKDLKLNLYGLKMLEGLPPFYTTKLESNKFYIKIYK